MFNRNNLRMPHRVDIMSETVDVSPSGQHQSTWTTAERSKCFYIPHRATVRVTPTQEETEKVMFFMPSDAPVEFKTRLSNLTDREGNVFDHLEGKTFEVVEINHFSNYAGKPHHIQVIAETVIE